MDISVDWKYDYRRSSVFEEIQTVAHEEPDRVFTEAGIYCYRGHR